jgi:hypothetical protein
LTWSDGGGGRLHIILPI